MTTIGNITVTASFNSGDFMNSFNVVPVSSSYGGPENNIQTKYNLGKKDFRDLEAMIASVITIYLEAKEASNE